MRAGECLTCYQGSVSGVCRIRRMRRSTLNHHSADPIGCWIIWAATPSRGHLQPPAKRAEGEFPSRASAHIHPGAHMVPRGRAHAFFASVILWSNCFTLIIAVVAPATSPKDHQEPQQTPEPPPRPPDQHVPRPARDRCPKRPAVL